LNIKLHFAEERMRQRTGWKGLTLEWQKP